MSLLNCASCQAEYEPACPECGAFPAEPSAPEGKALVTVTVHRWFGTVHLTTEIAAQADTAAEALRAATDALDPLVLA